MAAKKPMTTAEYFDRICSRLKERGEMPDDMLDYRLAVSHLVPITTHEFSARNNLDYGSSEGIYLDLAIEFYEGVEKQIRKLGTFKTLQDSPDAMRTMAKLLADFLVEERNYVNRHLNDFTWTGENVYALREDGTRERWSYSCRNRERALSKKDELLLRYPAVVIRDNATRKEIIFRKKADTGEERKVSRQEAWKNDYYGLVV